MSLLPGPQVYPLDEEAFFKEEEKNVKQKKKVLVYFLGGVTFAEIGALRFLNQEGKLNVKFIVATT